MFKVTTYYIPDINCIQQYTSDSTKVWADHVFYTRNYLISVLSNIEDVGEISSRLLQNQEDIGNLLRPYYDSATVDHLVELLKSHVTILVDIIAASLAQQPTEELVTNWRTNCEQIVKQLEEMNSYWEQSPLESLWSMHLTLTLNEVQYRLIKNWSSDIMNFDKITENIYAISDCIVKGVVMQNKIKFCTLSNGEHDELSK